MHDLTSFDDEGSAVGAQRCVIVNEQRLPSQQSDEHHALPTAAAYFSQKIVLKRK